MPPSARIPVDAVEGLDFRRIRSVSSLALFVVALGIGESFARERRRSGGRSSGARAKRAKELTTTDRPLAFRFHRRHLLWSLSSAANRASPDSSYCVFLCRSFGSAKASIGVLLPDRLCCTRVNGRGRAMRAWIDRTNDGLSGIPADGISLPPTKGGLRHVPLGRLEP